MDPTIIPDLQADAWRVSFDDRNQPNVKGITVNAQGMVLYDPQKMPSIEKRLQKIQRFLPSDLCGGVDLNAVDGDVTKLTANQQFAFGRSAWATMYMDPRARDIYQECGYPDLITPTMYDALYNREGHAARVVDVMPEECWATHPSIYEHESDDPEEEKPFEIAVKKVFLKHNLFPLCERLDKLTRIGHFGIMFFGLNDKKPLKEPAAGYNLITGEPADTPAKHEINFIRVFQETEVHIARYCTDQSSPRYSKPEMYLIRCVDPQMIPIGQFSSDTVTLLVHWTRVHHNVDDCKSSDLFSKPAMWNVYNRLQDIRKILSGSGEMYWKGAFPGFAFEVNPDLQDPLMDKESMREEFRNYSAGLERYLALTGVTVKSLPTQVSDPNPHLDAQLKAIAMAKAIPWKVFVGSEEAKLASQEDTRSWNKRLGRRQENVLNPNMLRPITVKLIAFGILPKPEEFFITWPDLDTPTPGDLADVALKLTQALATYMGGDCDMVFPLLEWLINVWKMKPALARAIVKARDEYIKSGEKLITPQTEADIAGAEAAAKAATMKPATEVNNAGVR